MHSNHPDWRDGDEALADLSRWLSTELSATVTAMGESLLIGERDALALRVIPCWLTDGGGWCSVRPFPLREPLGRALHPIGHRDLVLARDRSLGADSIFRKLIRLIKHLNARWERLHRNAPLRSFEIETLALRYCTRPMALAEAIPGFLAFTRDACSAYERRGKSATPESRPDWSVIAEAAERTELALLTDDSAEAQHILAGVFGDDRKSDDENCELSGVTCC
jgi:hypothetical protein